MSGFGAMPCGSSPYGFGTPLTAAGNEGEPLADSFGVSQGSRYINPRTRQYEYDANGRAKGMLDVPHLVQMAVLTVQGSSAMTSLGLEAPSGVIGANFVARRNEAVRNCLDRLVRSKLIEIVDIVTNATNRPVFTTVVWRDLTTTIQQETTL